MSHFRRVCIGTALATLLLLPAAFAQRPSPTPPPPSPSKPSQPVNGIPTTPQPTQPVSSTDMVMFLRGQLSAEDGTALPNDTFIERVCNNRVRQQVYASPGGEFNMQLGTMVGETPIDAEADPGVQTSTSNRTGMTGISRQSLATCELRISASGFRSSVVNLLDTSSSVISGTLDVGTVRVQRIGKANGHALDAGVYKAPPEARKAYERGLELQRKGKAAEAQKQLEKAVAIYPEFTRAWFVLGRALQQQKQNDAARNAYTRATELDIKFLPAYFYLASMAYEAHNWTEVLSVTRPILDLDPLNHSAASVYLLDLDPENYGEAYVFNAVANYQLNRMAEAEKVALKAEHVDLRTKYPQLHLVLADIYARKGAYENAISELQTYLALAPAANDVEQVRGELARVEKLNGERK